VQPSLRRIRLAAIGTLAAAGLAAAGIDGLGGEPTPARAARDLPTVRDVAGYTRWLKLRTAYAGGTAAHGGTKTIYVSNAAAARASRGKRSFLYPRGTTIVKTGTERTADGRRFLALVAIMEKTRRTDRRLGPRPEDWTWAEYTRDAPGEPLRLVASGSQGVCTGCHAAALRTDFAFTRLR
jgi:hypothetical protein